MKKYVSMLGLAAAIGVLATGTALATPIEMQITTGAHTTGVLMGTGGTVTYMNANFGGWDIKLTLGDSNSPSLQPYGLDLSSLTAECSMKGGCSSLTIAISDTDFAGPLSAGGLATSMSGLVTGPGTVTQWAYVDSTDTYFGKGSLIGTFSRTGPGIVSGTAVGGGGSAGPFSLTLIDTLSGCSGRGCATFSLDNDIVAAPEPGTLALFGAGLLGCALFVGRRRRSSQTRA